MFGIAHLLDGDPAGSSGGMKRIRRSVILTNLALLGAIGGLCWLMGWRSTCSCRRHHLSAGAAGVFLYVQHQFEAPTGRLAGLDVHDAPARQLVLRMPQPLQFFTGNIGLHHVHHQRAVELQPPARADEAGLPLGADAVAVDGAGVAAQAVGRAGSTGWCASRPLEHHPVVVEQPCSKHLNSR
jgi:hypothetical protein